MKYSELRKKNKDELEKMLKDLKRTLIISQSKWSLNLKENRKGGVQKSTAKTGDKTSLISNIKKSIAKVKTEIRIRELNEEEEE